MHNELIPVIYENGALHPLRPLPLPEKSRLQVWLLLPEAELPQEERRSMAEKGVEALQKAGLLLDSAEATLHPHISGSARQHAALIYGEAGPLSDWIIAERGEE